MKKGEQVLENWAPQGNIWSSPAAQILWAELSGNTNSMALRETSEILSTHVWESHEKTTKPNSSVSITVKVMRSNLGTHNMIPRRPFLY